MRSSTTRKATGSRRPSALPLRRRSGAPVPGTGGMRIIAGVVSVFTGAERRREVPGLRVAGFPRVLLLYRAFVTALPNADHHRYALLIFLWPTLLFWPSSIGKDCWMLFTLGIASLGAARILVRRPGGYTLLVIGLLLGSFVRPHVSLMALLAFGVALLVSRRESTRPGITPSSVAKVAGLVVLVAIGGVLASRAAERAQRRRLQQFVDQLGARRQTWAAPMKADRHSRLPTRRTRWVTWRQRSRSCSARSRSNRTAPSRSPPRSKACSCSGLVVASWRQTRDSSSDGCDRSPT